MSRTIRNNDKYEHKRDFRIRIRGVRREHPDVMRLAKAIVELALAAAEADAQAQHEAEYKKSGATSGKQGADHDETSEVSGDV